MFAPLFVAAPARTTARLTNGRAQGKDGLVLRHQTNLSRQLVFANDSH
jgi:hypothetical protein